MAKDGFELGSVVAVLYTYLPLNINSKYVTHMSASLAKFRSECTPVLINNSVDTVQPPRHTYTGANTVIPPSDHHGSELVSRPKYCTKFLPCADKYNSRITIYYPY